MHKVTETDTGTGVFTLVRVSHIHLFGITFIFFMMGTIFSHAYVRPVWFKCTVMAMPFIGLVADVSSWYFTKLYNPFAWVVMIAGGVIGPVVRVHVVRLHVPDVVRPPASAAVDRPQVARSGRRGLNLQRGLR